MVNSERDTSKFKAKARQQSAANLRLHDNVPNNSKQEARFRALCANFSIILKNAVESTTSGYDSTTLFRIINQARIAFFKKEIASGRYRIDCLQIAASMIADIEMT